MNKLLLSSLIAICSLSLSAQNVAPATDNSKETISLKETSFDFGAIPQGRPVTHPFEITNRLKDSLKLERVQASCGCTTPTWSKEAIAPGANTIITVGYNAANEGQFEKPVTITYNNGLTKVITIKGNVVKGPANTAPVNTSIQSLKQTNQ